MLMSIKRQPGLVFERLHLSKELGEALKKSDPNNTDRLTGFTATKKALLDKDLDSYKSMILATHGYFGTGWPGVMEPVLVLTLVNQPTETDGLLTMSEVLRLKLNADMVALTACQSGLGKQISGEGTMGMGRAFQYAGAKACLMSLWNVSEDTSVKLVERFFAHLKEGKSKLEALRLARQEVRQGGFDHPFFWASFILVGEVK
jgi:CHAT domain-containing protein